MLGFLILTVALKLGLYVGMVAYLFTVMLWQGRYRLPATAAVSFGTAAVLLPDVRALAQGAPDEGASRGVARHPLTRTRTG